MRFSTSMSSNFSQIQHIISVVSHTNGPFMSLAPVPPPEWNTWRLHR